MHHYVCRILMISDVSHILMIIICNVSHNLWSSVLSSYILVVIVSYITHILMVIITIILSSVLSVTFS